MVFKGRVVFLIFQERRTIIQYFAFSYLSHKFFLNVEISFILLQHVAHMQLDYYKTVVTAML